MASRIDSSRVVAVIGSGVMGAGIAQVAALAGHPVRLYDSRSQAATKALAEIRAALQRQVDKGRMRAADADAAGARIRAAASLDDLSDASLVMEAIVENLGSKRQLFADLEQIVNTTCIFASNTSSISITAIAAQLGNPARLVGMHFFNPVPLMELVEIISGLATEAAVADTVHATAIAWGKCAVHAKSTPGFIVNRVARPYYAEGMRLLTEQAADAATLDAVMREAGGFRMGPFELMDLIGHDVNLAVTQSVFDATFNDPRFMPSLIQQELVSAGFLGRKSGRGFYRYGIDAVNPCAQSEAAQARPDAGIVMHAKDAMAEALAARFSNAGIAVRHLPPAGADQVLLECGDARLYLTDGRSATQRADAEDCPNLVLLDLAFDFSKATRIALAKADQCSVAAYQAMVGLFQAAGFAVSGLDDVPGMTVMRTVAMLANEAADAVNQGVCGVAAVDLAMRKGVNYPLGPLAWADAIGIARVATVLHNLADSYGEDRYRVSPLIRRKQTNGENFHA
ncbi:3-hydroxyacyl-CoA dehydrogenase PaaH [Paraherbaspirillum soli]|uniref:3-hydroxyacyl-CoA dehydrogenase PaaH n=1 Tax=Paraherbaspirillum soli TaxID=631222 RepID=A0ABW0ME24_9BURK